MANESVVMQFGIRQLVWSGQSSHGSVRVETQYSMNISDKDGASIFKLILYPEDGGSTSMRNSDIKSPSY
jgi:hypothetical protein